MTASASPVSSSADTDTPQIRYAEFPLLLGREHLGISFQVRPEDAPARFYERANGVDAGERGVQAGNGELFGSYTNVRVMSTSLDVLGLKLVDVCFKKKVMPPKNKKEAMQDNMKEKPDQKRLRSVVYFWFAPKSDHRNFQDPTFYAYAMAEFKRLANCVYVSGESYANPHGPACIAFKGIAQASMRTELSIVEGDLEIS